MAGISGELSVSCQNKARLEQRSDMEKVSVNTVKFWQYEGKEYSSPKIKASY